MGRKGRRKSVWMVSAAILAAAVAAFCVWRPEPRPNPVPQQNGDGRLCVVTTIFPYYDFVRQIAGDRVDLKLIVPAGMDSHSFEPTPADMITMQEADVLVLNGGEMEHWVEQVLDSLDTSHMTILTMMDHVEAVEEEHVEGMEDGHEHGDHGHEAADYAHGASVHAHKASAHAHEAAAHAHEASGHAHEASAHAHEAAAHAHEWDTSHSGAGYDEHIWTSPVNAQAIVKIISQTLQEAAPEDAWRFQANTEAYLKDLEDLDQRFRQVVSQGRNHMIVVADKFPFRYFADEYGLSYRAAFSGCSTDTEPSARTIAYLIDMVKAEHIKAVYYLELSSHRTAEIISEETGAVPLLLHSCHNVTRREFDEGVTYLQLMNQNVKNLAIGLG